MNNDSKRDGRSKTRLYRTYYDMLRRCYNPHSKYYHLYGGRGIGVCREWRDSYDCFAEWSFTHGYDPFLPGKLNSIDRIDPDGDYSPENCRWITMTEQAVNKRCTVRLTDHGETHTLSEWADITGIDYCTLHRRYVINHWPADKVLIPPQEMSKTYTLADGRAYTVAQIAELANIPYWLAYARLNRTNWTPDEIVAGVSRSFESAYKGTDGKTYTLEQIAEMADVSRQTAWQRLNTLGWSIEKTISTSVRKAETYIDAEGREYTVREIAAMTGANPKTVRSRLKTLHWSVEECLAGCRDNHTKQQETA